MTELVDEGRAIVTVYLEFSNAFDTASHIILIDKLMKYGLALCSQSFKKKSDMEMQKKFTFETDDSVKDREE
ncbi:hypothetical protein llap_2066 [Limosa lapponica baueri]|uniref:Rna-directed dna polymerase from mobile element jockey-like n=1 Tax=Limosa lapponica baueri TaxID=1758121 RepID=A0A2I0UNH8_LIMLA|nr:hypothetical protein llap_2066 [Limosa lapponica baueri]